MSCKLYFPDDKFKSFKVVEFPITLVGLCSIKYLSLDVNLHTNAYIKTLVNGRLMTFEEAREKSSSHRAFEINVTDDHTLQVAFKPTLECIYKITNKANIHDRFVVDIHIIDATKVRCCDNERHSEIGRYYVCGLFEYCQIKHFPNIIDFDLVYINNKCTKTFQIINNSEQVTIKAIYSKIPGIQVTPEILVLKPKTIHTIKIVLRPTNLKIINNIILEFTTNELSNDNNKDVIQYKVPLKYYTKYVTCINTCSVESLHKLNEKNAIYTYTEEELKNKILQNKIKENLFKVSKLNRIKKTQPETVLPSNCYKYGCNISSESNHKFICQDLRKSISLMELFDIILEPFIIKFDSVQICSFGEKQMHIKNSSKYEVVLSFLQNDCITYTEKHLQFLTLHLKPQSQIHIKIYCLAFIEGTYNGTLEYIIENKFCMQHPFTIVTENPRLKVKETVLKFGMINSDNFVTSLPVTIYNNFNTSVDYKWKNLDSVPFEIIPKSGCVLPHSCSICNVFYNIYKPTKSKSHEIVLISYGPKKELITIDIALYLRKHAVCFMQPNIFLKDIPLNLEIARKIELENMSKEFAHFHIVEPIITGFTFYPMNGILKPRSFIILYVTIKIPYTLSFNFDLNIKINNKDIISLLINGTVVAPDLTIYPKNIHLQRIPSNMITYIPITIKNFGNTKSIITLSNEKEYIQLFKSITNFEEIFNLVIGAGETITVFTKILRKSRQEYDCYLPFLINNLLGPPKRDNDSSTSLQYYINVYEKFYENNPKVILCKTNKEICYCRIAGVITLPWIKLTPDKYEFEHPNQIIDFIMTNESKSKLPITINLDSLAPNFSINVISNDNVIINETMASPLKFEISSGDQFKFNLKFHPNERGVFFSVAELYLDKNLSLPYYNLTFIGRNEMLKLTPSTYKLVFAPNFVGLKLSKTIQLIIEGRHDLNSFDCDTENDDIEVTFTDILIFEENGRMKSSVITEITVKSNTTCNVNSYVILNHDSGCNCVVQICYCFTLCPLTTHFNAFVDNINQHPYPYYPEKEQKKLNRYMNDCTEFIENWLFIQGFRKEFYPTLPDSMYIISVNLTSQKTKTINLNVSYLYFLRRIAGPLMKLIPRIALTDMDASYRNVSEIHKTYKEIINLLKLRGADIWFLDAKYLLSYDQFSLYCQNIPELEQPDEEIRNLLLENPKLFYKISKQCWFDFVLQTYKVFVLDSCFFDCVCENMKNRNVLNIIIEWFNQQIKLLKNNKNIGEKHITNITSDLSDGVAFAAVILNHCQFLEDHFNNFIKIDDKNKNANLIHNASLIIEALNKIKIYFPIKCTDFIQPNYLQMFFLSIHLYIVLPLFIPKENIKFNPPLSVTSFREITLNSSTQEAVIYNYVLLNNLNNVFSIERNTTHGNKKKVTFNIKFQANFIEKTKTTLILQGTNKIRLFDTYIVFQLKGSVGSLIPHKKVKLICPLYRSNKTDILITTPYNENTEYKIHVLDTEPIVSTKIDYSTKSDFFVRRLNLIEKSIRMKGQPKGSTMQDVVEHKLCVNVTCISTRVENIWMWFRSDVGEFFIKVTIQAHWDHPIETLQIKLPSWPLVPCNCGEICECYRTTVISIPQRNDLLIKCLRSVLSENASEIMMKIFDELIDTTTGKEILRMLLEEGGTDMEEIAHIFRREIKYHITSRKIHPRINYVTIKHPFEGSIQVPITLPANSSGDKYTITLTSDCEMDIRVYRLCFVANEIIA